jgi:hypothetical protein
MRTTAAWASQNKWKARLCIVLLWILLHVIAFILSGLLVPGASSVEGIVWILSLSLVAAVSARHLSGRRVAFLRRKVLDGSIAAITFGLLFFAYGDNSLGQQQPLHASSTAHFSDSAGNSTRIVPFSKVSAKSKWKQIRHYLKLIRKDMRQSSGAGKAALIALVVLLGIGALMLVAALSCSISCNGGGEGLSITVALLGVGLVVFLAYLAINRIIKGPQKPGLIPAEGT